MRFSRLAVGLFLALVFSTFSTPLWAAFGEGVLRLRVIDAETKQPLAFRMHITNKRGRPVRPPRVPFWHDHFAADGEITLELKRGQYLFELECGPEFKTYKGHFDIQDHADDDKVVEMHRFTNLANEGWWAGDLNVQRPVDDMHLLMRADGVQLAAVSRWRRDRTKWTPPKAAPQGVVQLDRQHIVSDLAGEDARDGGGLLFFGIKEPLDLAEVESDYPSSAQLLVEAKRDPDVKVIAENAFWWDLPVWLASGRLDGIMVAGDHLLRHGVVDNEAWGKPRDRVLFPPPHGGGRWSEQIYYRVLNAGLRLPPVAASGTGIADNPLGYNRTYVYTEGELTWDKWWEAFAAGRVFISNGPLLRTTVMAERPGYVFEGYQGAPLTFEIGLTLSTRETIEYLEIVKNGRVEHHVRLDQFVEAKGRLPEVVFEESGWFLVRAVTNNQETYRFASTAPYYVEFDGEPRISREAVQFFLDWTLERARQIKLADPQQQADVLRYHRAAYEFWQNQLSKANAD